MISEQERNTVEARMRPMPRRGWSPCGASKIALESLAGFDVVLAPFSARSLAEQSSEVLICKSWDVTHRTVSGRILPGASQTFPLHMKANPAWAGRAVKPRSREAVREAQGLTARTSPKPPFAGAVMRLVLTLSV